MKKTIATHLFAAVSTALVLPVSTALVLLSCQATAPSGEKPAAGGGTVEHITVKIENSKFVPDKLTVKAGTKVTWTNADSAPHTATSTSGSEPFNTGDLNSGQSGSFTFTKAGTAQYRCDRHPTMTASVTVN